MKRVIEGEAHKQITLPPECLEDVIADDNSVRLVEAFVETLDLGDLGFVPGPARFLDQIESASIESSFLRSDVGLCAP